MNSLLPWGLVIIFFLALNKAHAQEGLLNNDYRDETCEMICLQDIGGYNLGIGLLSAGLPGDSLARVKYFYDNYSYDLPCPQKTVLSGKDACTHTGLNFLQTAIMDRADTIIFFIITQTNYDLDHKLSSGKSTLEWLSAKIESGDYTGEAAKNYLMRVLALMKRFDKKK